LGNTTSNKRQIKNSLLDKKKKALFMNKKSKLYTKKELFRSDLKRSDKKEYFLHSILNKEKPIVKNLFLALYKVKISHLNAATLNKKIKINLFILGVALESSIKKIEQQNKRKHKILSDLFTQIRSAKENNICIMRKKINYNYEMLARRLHYQNRSEESPDFKE